MLASFPASCGLELTRSGHLKKMPTFMPFSTRKYPSHYPMPSSTTAQAPASQRPYMRVASSFAALRVCALVFIFLPYPGAVPGAQPFAEDDAPPRVVATFYPLQVIALNVMAGIGEPSLLLEPSGGCAHGLALRPSQVRALGAANVILETGLDLEPFLADGRLPLRPGALRIAAAQLITDADLVPLAEEHDHALHAHGDRGHDPVAHGSEHGGQLHAESEACEPLGSWDVREGFNGHAWSSPRLGGRMAQAIGEGLAEADPARAARYRSQGEAYAAELYRLADDLQTAAVPLAGQRVVLSHTSLAYLARDLDLTVVATLRDEDENEPGSRSLARLIDRMRANGGRGGESGAPVDAILIDPQGEGRLERLVAAEAGVTRLLTLDPAAGGPVEPGAYLATMRRNLETIRAWADDVAKNRPAGDGPPDRAGAAHAAP